ncbi:uncharacterized protein LOC135171065 [Diachasmimorpha longicaudata]|uniref:uncharacterized protein LOC135171065 n=1 Tax=Diachasmimorpha longicaudata TaxID=58733 RepID=UPI0030B87981
MVTAKIKVMNNNNEFINCRTLLDSCSTTNLITERLATILGLHRKKFLASIGGLHNLLTKTQQIVTTTIKSRINDEKRRLTFLIIPSISETVPSQPLDREKIKIPNHLKLADPDFFCPAPIDMLIGTGTTIGLLGTDKMRLSPKNQPELYLLRTSLGWVIGGGAPTSNPKQKHSCHFTTTKASEFELARFCTIKITSLAIPQEELAQQYNGVLQEYIDLGHMQEVSPSSLVDYGYYLPHHAVFKEGSLTTKVRVVFDGSAKTHTGISLNETLHVGPTIQEDIFALLIRFRIHHFAVTADIEKMYRQVLVRPEDRKYQRILWRNDDGPVRTFQLNTVTFGLSAAPYLAIRSIHQLVEDDGHLYPIGAQALKNDCYVDDLISGADTRQGAIAIQQEAEYLVQRGGFKLRQWASNDPSLLQEVPPDDINRHLLLGDSKTLKTLGLGWNSTMDSIQYFVKSSTDVQITKRVILSETAKLFDPLGLLSPVVVIAKTFIQKLWELKVHWDTPLPPDIQEEWSNYYKELPLVQTINSPRRVRIKEAIELQLHGFCDASEVAYGACVYLRSKDKDGNVIVSLLCAKSRVAPLKRQTIPRLELCGALLLTTLVDNLKTCIHHRIDRICYWTDSTVVLHWLNTSSNKLPVFVSNRVMNIQEKTNISNWKHVRTHENPADLVSRGQVPSEFIKPSLWLTGAPWLASEETTWPDLQLQFSSPAPEEKKPKPRPAKVCLAISHSTKEKISRQGNALIWYSSMKKLERIIAHCLRLKNRKTGPMAAEELEAALQAIIYWVQQETFAPVIKALRQDVKSSTQQSELAKFNKLSPFLDKRGLLRVGGRLRNAFIPFSQRHPLILPKRHHVTRLIIENEHIEHLHSGSQATLYATRRRFWPLDGRNVTRQIVRSCIKCIRHKPPSIDYIMGSLPTARVTESRPFSNVGVDYCGPFFIKEKKIRNKGRVKIWVAVFVCLAVKAVHLEVVSDLSAETFIGALRRLVARRGMCINLYSDNGTNFVGANNELTEIYAFLKNEENQAKIKNYTSSKSIQWYFIPPQSPHFGEGVLNSRPITPISSDPNDVIALTPGHFLIGDSLTNLRGPNFSQTSTNRLSSWQHIQKLKQDFWSRWHREYISELSLRSKWVKGEHFIKEGTIVLIKEDNLPAQQWALGRVIHAHPGKDNMLRTVTLKTAKGIFDRSVKKLAPLLYNDE